MKESNVTPSDVTYSLGSIIVESNSTLGKIHEPYMFIEYVLFDK